MFEILSIALIVCVCLSIVHYQEIWRYINNAIAEQSLKVGDKYVLWDAVNNPFKVAQAIETIEIQAIRKNAKGITWVQYKITGVYNIVHLSECTNKEFIYKFKNYVKDTDA